jgi:hypothetical protein
MTLPKLVEMLLQDVADFMKGDAAGWKGGNMSIVLDEHGYLSSNI